MGELERGEGVFSLRRAFQQAGAGSILSTLWVLDDKATNFFMKRFYQHFLSGYPPQRSLRYTQIAFLRSEKYQHPYFWAPFVMNGLDRNFPSYKKRQPPTTSSFMFYIIIIVIIVGVIARVRLRKLHKKLNQDRQQRRLQRYRKTSLNSRFD